MSEGLARGPQSDIDRGLRDTIEDLQKRIAQRTAEVPYFPFVEGPDGVMHELVEEDVREADKEGEK